MNEPLCAGPVRYDRFDVIGPVATPVRLALGARALAPRICRVAMRDKGLARRCFKATQPTDDFCCIRMGGQAVELDRLGAMHKWCVRYSFFQFIKLKTGVLVRGVTPCAADSAEEADVGPDT